jgi:non-ribosomal peptide synthase protein (TIGR01720 family)
MEYQGRIDHQVKIRGHRIELGEIQSQLLKHDQIADAVVIEKEDRNGDTYLCAYIVSADAGALEKAPGTAELREYLSRILPDYMIPAYFVPLDKIPLTPNGKLDRKALPGPGHMEPANDGEYAAPRDAVEIALARTWKQVLGRDLIGINENFFAIGGDSIKCIQMASRMNEAGYKVDIRDIFQHPNIKDLAPLVKKARRIPSQSPITGNVPLTPIQVWFFDGQSGSPSIHYYNQAVMLRSKEDDRWSEKSLEIVLQKLQQHHDALRITYQIKEGKTLQINHGPDYPVWLQVVDLRGYEHSEAVNLMTATTNEIQAGIHLEKGPLMKSALYRLDDGDRLLMVIHHLVVDGLSWRILFEDLQTLYRQQQKGEPLELPAKTDSYQSWAESITHYANSETFLKERSYWETLGTTVVPPIKRDFPAADDPNLVKDTAEVSFELDERKTALLLTTVNHAFGTEINDILLTGLGLALKQTFDIHRLLIALEGHGRETIIEHEDIDISRTVGWFTTIYPVLLDISYENDLARQVKEIKETLRKVPHKGIGYGILKYLTIKESKKIDLNITPRVSFNYLGQFDTEVERMSFQLAREPVGQLMGDQTRRCFDLDITGMMIEKRLIMSITYNRKHYRTKTLETLAHQFRISLGQIISYCAARPHRELTPSDFTYKGLSIETVDQLNSQYDIEDLYLLSPMQEGMLFHALYDNASAGYFEQISYTLEGEVDESLIEQSINQLIRRHPTLRTLFLHQGFERPIQLVLKERKPEFYYQDLRDLEKEHEIQTFIREFKERDQQRLFDVSKDTLMRAALFRVDNNRFELTWSLHHIIMDGWCLSIVDNEFSEIYQSLKESRAPRLEPVTPYSRYIRWIEAQDSQAAKNYWQEYLQGYEQTASLPKKILTAQYDYITEHEVLELTAEQMKELKHLARKYQVTMNTLMRVTWGILLAKYNGRQDVVFGAVVSGRPPDIQGVNMIIGLFINTIPVRIRFDNKTTFARLIKDVQAQAVESEHYHHYPLASIQADHPLKQQLLDHLFTFQNYQKSEDIAQLSGKTHLKKETAGNQFLNLRNTEAFERTNYDFNILVIPGETLKIIFQYNSNVHVNSMVTKLVRQWQDIVDQVISSETIEINEIKISFDLVAIQPVHLQEDEDEFGF